MNSEEKILSLIEAYKNHPTLWNPAHRHYFKKSKKLAAWTEIATQVGSSEEECKKKIISLLSSYRREKSKTRKSQGTWKGKGSSDTYTSRWFAYESFRFLEGRDKPINRQNAESVDDDKHDEDNVVIQTQDPLNEDTVFLTPRRQKRAREESNKDTDGAPLLATAVNILQTTAGKLDSAVEDPEIKSFCAFLSSKMMSYSATTRLHVQHAIYDILVKADMGVLERTTLLRREPNFSSLPVYPMTSSPYAVPFQQFLPSASYPPAPEIQRQNHESTQTVPLTNAIPPLTPLNSLTPPSSHQQSSVSLDAPSPAGSSMSQSSDDLNEYV